MNFTVQDLLYATVFAKLEIQHPEIREQYIRQNYHRIIESLESKLNDARLSLKKIEESTPILGQTLIIHCIYSTEDKVGFNEVCYQVAKNFDSMKSIKWNIDSIGCTPLDTLIHLPPNDTTTDEEVIERLNSLTHSLTDTITCFHTITQSIEDLMSKLIRFVLRPMFLGDIRMNTKLPSTSNATILFNGLQNRMTLALTTLIENSLDNDDSTHQREENENVKERVSDSAQCMDISLWKVIFQLLSEFIIVSINELAFDFDPVLQDSILRLVSCFLSTMKNSDIRRKDVVRLYLQQQGITNSLRECISLYGGRNDMELLFVKMKNMHSILENRNPIPSFDTRSKVETFPKETRSISR